jgi:hypothetical protein
MLVAMYNSAVLVRRDDGHHAAFLLGNGLTFFCYRLMTRLLVVIVMIIMLVIIMGVFGILMLIVLMRVGQGRGRLRRDDSRRLGRLAACDHLGRSIGGRVMIMVIVVMVMIIIVMVITMGMLVLMTIVVIMVMGIVLGMRLAEAMFAEVVGVIVLAVLTLVGAGLGRLRLRIVAFEFVTFMALGLRRGGRLDDVALHALSAAAAARTAMAVAAAIRAVLALLLGFAVRTFLGLDQGLTVGDGDLIIIRMDFAEGEKAVAIAAIFDEGRLERGFDPRDLGEVDVPTQLLALGGLEIKFLDAVAANDNDPGLFRVGSIDQHLVGHIGTLGGDGRVGPRARGALSDDATVHLIRG